MHLYSLITLLVVGVVAVSQSEARHFSRGKSWPSRRGGHQGFPTDLQDIIRKLIYRYWQQKQQHPTPPPRPLLPALASDLGLNTLVDLVTQAGLGAALSGAGPFTVFGPTDAAFANLSPEVLAGLQGNPSDLAEVLKYHVLPSATFSTDLKNELLAPSLQGAPVRINSYPATTGAVTAQCQPIDVRRVDQEAGNGVLHVMGGVMIPPAGSIKDILAATPDLATLAFAVTTAQLDATLAGPGPFTVFAPTNAAFNAVSPAVLNAILADVTVLQEVLTYHVVASTQCSAGLTSGVVATVNGETVEVAVGPGGVSVNDAAVLEADVSVTNGVVHVIDQVLIPPSLLPAIVKLAA